MLQIGLRDINFAHVFSSSGWNTPKYFNWCRTGQNKICFFTDLCLGDAANAQSSKKIAWLLEPPAANPASYDYIQKHLDQFDYILTYNRQLVDNCKILYYPYGGCWMQDVGDQRNRQPTVGIHKKHQLISIIASGKTELPGHQLRHSIIDRYPNITTFGSQYRALEYKEDALLDFMFSIVVENSQVDDYFTEKLIDCLAVGTIPIYWGTRNIGQYFDIGGILTFDNLDELNRIIVNLSPELYNNRMRQIQDNFYKQLQYHVAEDWIFEHYPHLFRT
jgi:hypothetical protein